MAERGPTGLWESVRRRLRNMKDDRAYQKWVRRQDEETTAGKGTSRDLTRTPLFSVILPVYNTDEKWLRLCIESVLHQTYENWELCIADDHSSDPRVRRVLEEYASKDERIKVVMRAQNGHISAASNSALETSSGEFAVLLDHDDELSHDALYWVAKEINDFPEVRMIYSDEDLIDEAGRRYGPKLKPDFSLDLLYSLNLVTHLSVYKLALVRNIGGFRIGFEGSQDYDLALRVVERISVDQIRHIPRILYHWRAIKGSVAFSADEKPYAHERARAAIREHLKRSGVEAEVEPALYNFHRVRYRLPSPEPRVDVFVFSCENLNATESIVKVRRNTDYRGVEFIPVQADGNIAASLNRSASSGNGELICFVAGGFAPVDLGWLTELAGFAIQSSIGAVGGKLLDRDQTVISSGLFVGLDDVVALAHAGLRRYDAGNMGRNVVSGNFSAVSAMCMMTRREIFETERGFDADVFPNCYFDVDYCLKLGQKHLRVVLTPYVELIRAGNAKVLGRRCPGVETEDFNEKWTRQRLPDRFHNPNLSKKRSIQIDV